MKKLLPLLLLATQITFAQGGEGYFSLSIDPNKAFGLVDNPRTEEQNKGIHYTLEAGVYADIIGIYAYYGRFNEIGYQIYGVGIDVYLAKGDWYDIAIGLSGANLMREKATGAYWERTAWFGFLTFNSRASGVFWIWRNLGTTASLTYQRRPDLPKVGGIIEGAVGLRYKL